MPVFQGFKGALRILNIRINGTFVPVGCLTENSFSEQSDLLPTTTRETGGWETSVPVTQRYSIDFTALQINSAFPGGNSSFVSYDYLRVLKREKIRINWRIESIDDPLSEEGFGYINDLSEGAPVDDMVSFTGSIIGFSVPSEFVFTYMLNPANGALLNLTQGAAISLITITFNTSIVKNSFIGGVITNTTTMATVNITNANTSVAGGVAIRITGLSGFFSTAAIYTVQLNAAAAFDDGVTGAYSPEVTPADWSFEVREGDWLAADWDNNDWFTN